MEIKFKGFSKKEKRWIYGFYYEECGNSYIIENRQAEHELNRNHIYEIDKNTLSVFTGFYDINGIEIYSRSQILFNDKIRMQVYFDKNFGAFKIRDIDRGESFFMKKTDEKYYKLIIK